MNRKIKAELWDKMQFMFRNYYDRMVHGYMVYDGLLDVSILKTILIAFTELEEVLHSRFVEDPIDPYWEIMPYSIDDILTVKEVTDVEKETNAFLTQTIPYGNNVQYKIGLFIHENKTHFCMIVNHMCFDGGDFKYFIAMLAQNYNNLQNGITSIELKTGSRSYNEIYKSLDNQDKKAANKLYKNVSVVKDEHQFPLSPAQTDDYNMIKRRKISKELFEGARQTAKKLNATVNDLLLAVYVHALYDIGGYKPNDTLTIPCMVDLRRHLADGGLTTGLTNHTGFMQCSVKEKGSNMNETLLHVVRDVNKAKRDKYLGLYSLPLIKLAYTVFPYKLSEFAIMKGYLNPLIGMSNIGMLNPKLLSFNNAPLVDGFITGAVKYKPYMQLAVTTLNGEATLTVAIRGNKTDSETVEKFFDLIEQNFADFINLNQ